MEPGDVHLASTSVVQIQAKTTYPDIVQRMVRRYLFKQDRLHETERLDVGRWTMYFNEIK